MACQGHSGICVCFAFLLANMLSEVQVCMLCTLYTPLNCITENDIQESKMYTGKCMPHHSEVCAWMLCIGVAMACHVQREHISLTMICVSLNNPS